MTLHLIKLCVGVDTPDELREWVEERVAATGEHTHVTRMFPRRADELVAGGSLYWVIRGVVLVRQRIVALRPVRRDDHDACAIVLEPRLVPTSPWPRRPFQGWRYLAAADAPPDLSTADAALPEALRAELALLGLL
ncbi:MAG: DUF1489 domain-containing protein [Bauldia sp.]|nr:DUF1489 domain-containing protein [Bauldia sp.]